MTNKHLRAVQIFILCVAILLLFTLFSVSVTYGLIGIVVVITIVGWIIATLPSHDKQDDDDEDSASRCPNSLEAQVLKELGLKQWMYTDVDFEINVAAFADVDKYSLRNIYADYPGKLNEALQVLHRKQQYHDLLSNFLQSNSYTRHPQYRALVRQIEDNLIHIDTYNIRVRYASPNGNKRKSVVQYCTKDNILMVIGRRPTSKTAKSKIPDIIQENIDRSEVMRQSVSRDRIPSIASQVAGSGTTIDSQRASTIALTEQKLRKAESDVRELQRSVDKARKQADKDKDTIAKLTQKIESLTTDNTRLCAYNEQLRNKVEELTKENRSLSRENSNKVALTAGERQVVTRMRNSRVAHTSSSSDTPASTLIKTQQPSAITFSSDNTCPVELPADITCRSNIFKVQYTISQPDSGPFDIFILSGEDSICSDRFIIDSSATEITIKLKNAPTGQLKLCVAAHDQPNIVLRYITFENKNTFNALI